MSTPQLHIFTRAPLAARQGVWRWQYRAFMAAVFVCVTCFVLAVVLACFPISDVPQLHWRLALWGLPAAAIAVVVKPIKFSALYLRGFGRMDENVARDGFTTVLSRRLSVFAIHHHATNLGSRLPWWLVGMAAGIIGALIAQVSGRTTFNPLWFALITGSGLILPFEGAVRDRLVSTVSTKKQAEALCGRVALYSHDPKRMRRPWQLRLRRKLLGATTEVRTTEELWRYLIPRLAASASVIVVDISSPGDGLIWELEQLGAAVADRMILVSRQDPRHIGLSRNGASVSPEIHQRLIAAASPFPVLTRQPGPFGDHVFARELSVWAAHVAQAAAGRHASGSPAATAIHRQRPDKPAWWRWTARAMSAGLMLCYLGWVMASASSMQEGTASATDLEDPRLRFSPSFMTHIWVWIVAVWLWKLGE